MNVSPKVNKGEQQKGNILNSLTIKSALNFFNKTSLEWQRNSSGEKLDYLQISKRAGKIVNPGRLVKDK